MDVQRFRRLHAVAAGVQISFQRIEEIRQPVRRSKSAQDRRLGVL